MYKSILKQINAGLLLATVIAGALTPLWGAPQTGQAAAAPISEAVLPPGVQLLAADKNGITVELLTPEFALTTTGDCQQLSAPDTISSATPGAPALPTRGVMLGIPAQSDASFAIVDVESTLLPGRYTLCPTPTPIVDFTLDGSPDYQGYAVIRDAEAYARNAFAPAVAAALVETGFIRSQRFAQLRFQPFQYNPVTGELRQHTRIVVRVDFSKLDSDLTQRQDTGFVDEGIFEQTLRELLPNYEQARGWRARPAAPPSTLLDETPTAIGPAYQLHVNSDGLYRVTRADLEAAGANLAGVHPRTFRMTQGGQPVAIHVTGEADGSFDAEDVILFYGEALDTKYTNTNVYWLTWGGPNGLRMGTRDGTPDGTGSRPVYYATSLHLEQNRMYNSRMRSGDDDYWYWNYIYYTGGEPLAYDYPFVLPALMPTTPVATLQGTMRSYGAFPTHHTQILLNGHLLHDETWLPSTEYAFTVDFSPTLLLQGANTITVRAGVGEDVTTDIPVINWFRLDYHAPYRAVNDSLTFGNAAAGLWEYVVNGFTTNTMTLLDVTQPHTPARITGANVSAGTGYTLTFQQENATPRRYLALTEAQQRSPAAIIHTQPVGWRSPTHGADYIIISPAAFHPALQPLIARRAAQGLRIALVDVQDVYDEFSHGLFTPEAIRDFVTYAYHHWVAPAPTYLLLVGNGHYDFHNYMNRGQPNHIPPYLDYVDPWMGETAADNRYVAVSGDDMLPDLHLGRLPARNLSEAQVLVNKILAYEDAPLAEWQSRHLFIADNADNAGNFPAFSDIIVNNHLPAPYIPDKVYLYDTHPTVAESRTAIRTAINEGQLIVNYVGHGGPQIWANERLMDFNLLSTLNNVDKLAFFLPMTCYEGHYITPNYPALGEAVVRRANGGAIASWSPTGLGVAAGHDYLHRAIYEAFFYEGIAQFGPATTYAKYYLYASTAAHRELLDTYLLFGDPALALKVLPTDVSISKTVTPNSPVYAGDPLIYTLTITNAGPAMAHRVVLTDLLPAGLINPTVAATGVTLTPRPGAPFVWDVNDLAPGAGGVITIHAQVAPTFIGTLINTASIATTAIETDTTNNSTPPVVTTVVAPDLSIHQTGPAGALPGAVVTYRLTYHNAGTAPAEQVVITNLLPGALLTPTVTWSGTPLVLRPGAPFVWDAGTLPPGASGALTITATIDPAYRGNLGNLATISTTTVDYNPANNTSQTTTRVEIANLVLNKHAPAEAVAGELLRYVLTYTNIENGPALQVVLTDTLPAALQQVVVTHAGAGTPVVRSGTRYVWDLGTLPAGTSGVITLTGTVAPSFWGLLENTATIATASTETTLADNTAGPRSTLVRISDVGLSKSGPATVTAGERITYTLTFSNTGDATARQIVLSDPLPPALRNPTFTVSGIAATARPGTTLVWDVADLPPGAQGTIIVAGTAGTPANPLIYNTAAITTATGDRNPANNSAGPVVTDILIADLAISKTGPHTAWPGELITYTLTYANIGRAPATGVVITDLLSTRLLTPTFAYSGAPPTPRAGQPFVWDVGALPPGAGGVITITAIIEPEYRGGLLNRARIASDAPEAVYTNNQSQQVVTSVQIPHLVLTKHGPEAVEPGARITYTLAFVNTGNMAAEGVVLTDLLPAALLTPTVQVSDPSIVWREGTHLVWDVPDLAPGASGSITIVGTLAPDFYGALVNTATITNATGEAHPENTTATVTTLVHSADLAVQKIGPTTVWVGERVTYTLAYTNLGTATAHQVTLHDALPPDLVNPTYSYSGAEVVLRPGSALLWDIANLAPGTGGIITVTAQAAPGFWGVLTNTAVISTTTPEHAVTNNHTGPITTTVLVSDVRLTHTGTAEARAGTQVTYTLAFSNTGNGLASDVAITNLIPAALLTPTVTFTGTPLTPHPGTAFVWEVGDLASGASGRVTLTAHLAPHFVGLLTHTAFIATSTADIELSNNTPPPVVTRVIAPDLALSKTGPLTAWPGEMITYTLVYTNVGDAWASGVLLTDTLPVMLLEPGYSFTGTEVTLRADTAYVWEIADLAPGAGGIITITGWVASTFIGTLSNHARLSTTDLEVNLTNNADNIQTGVLVADLMVTKSGPPEIRPGETITYVITYRNRGNIPAHDVVLVDTLSTSWGQTAPGLQMSHRATLTSGGHWIWALGTLAPDATGNITIVLTYPDQLEGIITNRVTMTTETRELTLANNSALVTTRIVPYRIHLPLVQQTTDP